MERESFEGGTSSGMRFRWGNPGGGESTSMLTNTRSPKEGARRVLEILRRG